MSLKGAIDKFNKKMTNLADDEFKALVIGIANKAIENTPVDTGRLRGNWQLAFGRRPTGNPYEPSAQTSGNEYLAESESKRRIQAEAKARINRLSNGDAVAYISNNLPYAMAVEAGGPTNRPRRMLARAILKASTRL